jgi:hypothetical protein
MLSHVIAIEFVSLDGVVQDPNGNEGFRHGGWAFRYGPEPVTGALNRDRGCAVLAPAQHENDEHDDYDEDNRPDTDIHRLSFPGSAWSRQSMKFPAPSSRVAFDPATLT